ncbi:MAG: ELM1/GtrOC1 family putative glycosyltransferase [Desulfobacterales bacterium]|nr:ELM1/GtrOC1 family putative glycosyltransferase [Desulfobacterales bacterium]
MKSLKILAVTDNRPGHVKQTEAIIRSLSDLTPVDIEYMGVNCDLKSDLKNWTLAIISLLRQSKKPSKGPDIVIGTGSHTHATAIRMSIPHGSKKIICMSPPTGFRYLFDLCLIPQHDMAPPTNNSFFTTGPPNLSKNLNGHDTHKGLILIGGIDPKSHKWNSKNIFESVKSIIDKEQNIQWTISTSPRSPEDMEKLLFTASKKLNYTFCPFSQTPKYWLEKQYAENKYVWVTADSMSMVYEAISAGCSVGLIPIEWKNPNNKFSKSEKNLVSKGYVASYEKWLKDKDYPTRNHDLNEAKRCAVEILKRWWPERLP